jgi:transposase
MDLRERIFEFVSYGNSRRKASEKFNVSTSSAIRFASYGASGQLGAKKQTGRPRKLDAHWPFILQKIEELPDITLLELCEELALQGVSIHNSNLSRFLIRKGYSYKKNTFGKRTRACKCEKAAN